MRIELFWLLSFCGFAALSLVCGLLVWPQLSAAWPSIQEQIDRFHRLPSLAKVVVLVFVAGFIAYGSTKTNLVDESESEVEVEQWNLSTCSAGQPEQESNILCSISTSDFDYPPPTVTPEDIARGWQLWEVRTNCNITYTMPEGAVLASNWWVRGAYEDCSIVRLGDCSIGGGVNQSNNLNNPNNQTMTFPFGTNEYSSLWAHSWGKVRFALADTNTEIVAVGAPISAVPYRSRLWSAVDANGAKVVTWENFALNRDTNTPVNAQVELRANGDFFTRSNEVETVYRYIDSFDKDGDGIPDDQDWDPYWYDGDYSGQEDWWREYVDECVGANQENGYYKLTATFPSGYFRRTQLCVGNESIIVAEPGEYVFLLEKGNVYDIVLAPFVEGVSFDAVDDIPVGHGLMTPLMLGRGHWEGKWSRDEGELYLDPPQMGAAGCVMWTPKLCVSPDEWNPSAGDRSETFTAMLFDRTDWMEEPTYQWESANRSVTFGSPAAVTTRATWQMGDFETVSAHLTVSFGYRQLESTLGFTYHDDDDGDDDPAESLSFWIEDMPDTLFVNNDNDLGNPEEDFWYFNSGDNDVPCATIRFRSSVPTNGTIRIDNLTGFTGSVYTYRGSSIEEVFAGTTWPIRNSTGEDFQLYFNAGGKSRGFETSQIKVRWVPEVGQEKTCVKRFTVVEPVAEPVCTETKPVSVNGETVNLVYNPCGVAVGRDAYFKIEVKPTAYPDSMIEWETSGGGSVQFVGGNHGREVHVRGVSPGDVTLSAKLGNCVSPPPSFTFRVVTSRTIRLSAWIVSDKDGVLPRSIESVLDMVKMANDIYSQVGVTFDLGDRITVTNIPAAYDINEVHETEGRWNLGRLTGLATGTGGLECYFVNTITRLCDDGSTAFLHGLHFESGLAVASSGGGVVLAHESGHAFGMDDIYCEDDDANPFFGLTRQEYWLNDWNGGSASLSQGNGAERYYKTGTEHTNVVRRLLMDGRKRDPDFGIDILYGGARGYGTDNAQGDQDTGFFSPERSGYPTHR